MKGLWMLLLAAGALPAGATLPSKLATRLDLVGDFRLRYEANSAVEGGPERHRGVLRLRLGASYEVDDWLRLGARVATGDPGDPRTTDVTLGDFADDLELSLDLAYFEIARAGVFATGGKFRNPFTTTELVWDGDVDPVGAAGWIDGAPVAGFTPRLAAIFMIVDEQRLGDDGTMWGLQARLARTGSETSGLEIAAGYWDYTIESLADADDPGDVRGNHLSADGTALLSDFDLADLVITLSLPGPDPRWPLRLVGDYVVNLGAAVDEDRAFQVQGSLGKAWTAGAVELQYGYAECETDAVLGAFSHDNLPLATNYRAHTARASWSVRADATASLAWAWFRPLDPGAVDPGYRSRVRLDFMVRF